MNIIRINGIAEYIQQVTSLKPLNSAVPWNNDDDIPYLIKRYVFRGQNNVSYELIPSLGRQKDNFFDEGNLITMAKMRFPEVFKRELDPIELLTMLQHYGIPTRLLDLTENALVALFFACLSSNDKDSDADGEVFVFKYEEDSLRNYPITIGIAESYKLVKGTTMPLDLFFRDVIEQPYFSEMRVDYKDRKARVNWIKDCCSQPSIIYSSHLTVRQKIQSGMYMLFPNEIIENGTESYFRDEIKPLSKDDKSIEMRFIIPREKKKEILDHLDLLGINRMNLFADSIDIVNEELTKRYFYKKNE